MAIIYVMVCFAALACAFGSAWDFTEHRPLWGTFWLTLAIICQILVVVDYNIFVE